MPSFLSVYIARQGYLILDTTLAVRTLGKPAPRVRQGRATTKPIVLRSNHCRFDRPASQYWIALPQFSIQAKQGCWQSASRKVTTIRTASDWINGQIAATKNHKTITQHARSPRLQCLTEFLHQLGLVIGIFIGKCRMCSQEIACKTKNQKNFSSMVHFHFV